MNTIFYYVFLLKVVILLYFVLLLIFLNIVSMKYKVQGWLKNLNSLKICFLTAVHDKLFGTRLCDASNNVYKQ